jgi:excinuclease ABC subunit C
VTELERKLDDVPTNPGVYLMKDRAGKVIYVGKAASLRPRVRSYFQERADLTPRTAAMVDRVADVDWIVTDSEIEAFHLEFNLVQRHRPRYNVRLSDDKRYPYVKVTLNEPFPRIVVVRRIERDGARYFGPYANTQAMWATIRLVRQLFGVRQSYVGSAKKRGGCPWTDTSKWRARPCLDYHIRLCIAPCSQYATAEEYREAADKVVWFLEGNYDRLVDHLRAKMEEESAAMRFESAARYRDQIEAIEKAMAEQKMTSLRPEDEDILADVLRADQACVGVSLVREGKLIGQEHYLLQAVSGLPEEHVLAEFVKQHYEKSAMVPRRILLPHAIEDADAIAAWLADRRGSKVALETPRRGVKRELVELALQNARLYLDHVQEREDDQRRRGQEAVAELQRALDLTVPPNRIEAFDISTLHGAEAVGSMIVFEGGVPRKSDYRRFKVRLDKGEADDFALMREVLSRRLGAAMTRHQKFETLPDLLLVDGGKGQLNVALRALRELNLGIPAAGLAKEHESLFVEGRAHPIALPAHSRALHLLQRVRDEAHRFAITYHRSLRSRRTRESVLDGIRGVGKVRKQKLLTHFGSIRGIARAPAEEIARIAGVGKETVRRIQEAVADDGERATRRSHEGYASLPPERD